MEIKIANFATNITNGIIGDKIYQYLKEELTNHPTLVIDFFQCPDNDHIFVQNKFLDRFIWEIGSDAFFKKLNFKNVNDSIKYVLTIGISNNI